MPTFADQLAAGTVPVGRHQGHAQPPGTELWMKRSFPSFPPLPILSAGKNSRLRGTQGTFCRENRGQLIQQGNSGTESWRGFLLFWLFGVVFLVSCMKFSFFQWCLWKITTEIPVCINLQTLTEDFLGLCVSWFPRTTNGMEIPQQQFLTQLPFTA